MSTPVSFAVVHYATILNEGNEQNHLSQTSFRPRLRSVPRLAKLGSAMSGRNTLPSGWPWRWLAARSAWRSLPAGPCPDLAALTSPNASPERITGTTMELA